jgi:hypothetical protein
MLVAITALLVLSLMGGLVLAALRVRIIASRRAMEQVSATGAAEAGIARLLAQWPTLGAESLTPGEAAGVEITSSGPYTTSADSVIRLGPGLFLLRVTGELRDAGDSLRSRHRLGLLVRLPQLRLGDSAALSARGAVRIRDLARVSGVDAVPPGWAGLCPDSEVQDATGVALGPGGALDTSLCSGCVLGTPPSRSVGSVRAGEAGLVGSALATLGLSADTMVSGTVPVIGPVVAGASCLTGDGLNWGDPEHAGNPCFSHFPVIAAGPGSLLSDGVGQGLLVSQGDLVLAGSFRYYGVVLVSGSLVLKDQARVTGAVLAGGATEDSAVVEGGAQVTWSGCAVRRALARAGRPVPIAARAWWRWF